jgi:hypothetical protein
MAESSGEIHDIIFLLQKIESIIDARLIGEVEPREDEISLIEDYQAGKREGTLELHEI